MRLYAMLAAMLLAGCVSSGTQVKESTAAQFQNGVTTEADVVRDLGPPQGVTSGSDGKRLLVYSGMHAQVKGATLIPIVGLFAGGATTQVSTVVFTFGQDGKLESYTITQNQATATAGAAAAK